MTRVRRSVLMIRMAATLCVLLLLPLVYAQQSEKKEYTFHGKVQNVDSNAKTLTVNGEKVEGWMGAMTMTYSVDKEDALKRVKVGDQITAKVREGDHKTLYGVQIAQPTANTSPGVLVQTEEKEVGGTVTKVTDNSITVNNTIVVAVVPETKITKGNASAKIGDLRSGDRVIIHAKEIDGKLVANSVQFGPAPAEEHQH